MTSDKSYASAQQLAALAQWSDANGVDRYTDAGGTSYATGHAINYLTADAPTCTSSSQTATGLALPVSPGSYWFDVTVMAVATGTNDMYLSISGPTTSAFNCWIFYGQLLLTSANDALGTSQNQTVINSNTSKNSNPLVVGNTYYNHLFGYATFTAAGSISVAQAASNSTTSFTVKKGSVLRLYTV